MFVDERLQIFAGGAVVGENFLEGQRLGAEGLEDGVVFLDARRELCLEARRVNQIDHAQADARGFVAVGGADAALGGADFVFALEHFALGVQFAVIGKDDVGGFADEKLFGRDFDAEFSAGPRFPRPGRWGRRPRRCR